MSGLLLTAHDGLSITGSLAIGAVKKSQCPVEVISYLQPEELRTTLKI